MPNKYSSIEIDGGPMVALAREALGEDAVGLAERAGASYERRICELLAQIGSKKTGRAVLRAIQLQTVDGYGLRIEPYPIKQPDRTPNADAGPEPRIGKRRAGREGRRRDSTVRFTPAHWGKADPALHRLGLAGSTYGHGPGNEPDEMLLHEMVHGLRIMSGVAAGPYSRRAVPGQAQYDTMEEFYAILVANIYRSEWRRPGLRWDHSRFFISHDITDEAFLKTERNRRHLRQLRRQNRSLFDGLSDVDAPFNPTRALGDG